jgi:hypothetical protein
MNTKLLLSLVFSLLFTLCFGQDKVLLEKIYTTSCNYYTANKITPSMTFEELDYIQKDGEYSLYCNYYNEFKTRYGKDNFIKSQEFYVALEEKLINNCVAYKKLQNRLDEMSQSDEAEAAVAVEAVEAAEAYDSEVVYAADAVADSAAVVSAGITIVVKIIGFEVQGSFLMLNGINTTTKEKFNGIICFTKSSGIDLEKRDNYIGKKVEVYYSDEAFYDVASNATLSKNLIYAINKL